MRLMTLIKLVKLFVLWGESDSLYYCTGDVVYLIPLKKKQFQVFQYSIDVVAVNYAVFAISV